MLNCKLSKTSVLKKKFGSSVNPDVANGCYNINTFIEMTFLL